MAPAYGNHHFVSMIPWVSWRPLGRHAAITLPASTQIAPLRARRVKARSSVLATLSKFLPFPISPLRISHDRTRSLSLYVVMTPPDFRDFRSNHTHALFTYFTTLLKPFYDIGVQLGTHGGAIYFTVIHTSPLDNYHDPHKRRTRGLKRVFFYKAVFKAY